jgi:endonuclease/exonuclease/phosphatase family metal-dependent hydrolase
MIFRARERVAEARTSERLRARPWRAEASSSSAVAAVNPGGLTREPAASGLKLLSFNIQTGTNTRKYRHYVTKGWKHVLPHESRADNLRQIADLVEEYDVVALQEVDGGSLRSGFIDQVEYLAYRARFPFWYTQLNRDLGPLAQHGNGLLSRVAPLALEDHKLPGAIRGRGAIVSRLRFGETEVVLVLLHLSLGDRSRQRQLSYVRDLIAGEPHVVVMGDMNSHLSEVLFDSPLADTGLVPAEDIQPTYPSWRPSLALDHVLATPSLCLKRYEVLECRLSDHCPIAVTLGLQPAPGALPAPVRLAS